MFIDSSENQGLNAVRRGMLTGLIHISPLQRLMDEVHLFL